ncbi:MAG: MFS transporter [Candidatus Nanopelagicaceae bacterium]
MKERVRLGRNYWRLWSATAISNLGDGIALIAYPWLASAITRDPFLIALAGVVGRLPWLLFTLPAGVITDRVERRKIIVSMDLLRGALTVVVALIVWQASASLPDLDSIATAEVTTNWSLYAVILIASLIYGMAEVLRDNAAQTFMPQIVEKEKLEVANGRMWSAEYLTNSFMGPPLGSFLIGIAIFIPFFVDAATFFIAVILIAGIRISIPGEVRSRNQVREGKEPVRLGAEVKEGFQWLWRHELLRPMAIILGLLNFLATTSTALFILFAQEVLETSVLIFAILGTAGAAGGMIGGLLAPRISKRLGSGATLALALFTFPTVALIIGLTSFWPLVWFLTAFSTIMAVVWNVITVSLRQSIIPSHLLGRVNSVYRFFAWGSMPLGMLTAGLIVNFAGQFVSREGSLRTPYFFAAVAGYLLYAYARRILTTERIEAARTASSG